MAARPPEVATPGTGGVQSPLRWAGGKKRIAGLLARALPPHRTYVEPFGGAASVLLAKPKSPVEVYNDLDGELVNFFRVLQEEPEAFLHSFRWALVARSEYERLAALDPAELSPVDRAHRFFYLVMGGWGAEAGRPRFQTAVRDKGGGNRLIGALAHLEERIRPVHQRLQGVLVEALPWQEVLARYDGPGTVFYLDPPYPNHQVRYGVGMRDLEDHHELWRALARLEGRWLLSTYDDPELRKEMGRILGDGVRFYPLHVPWGLRTRSRGRGLELLACNYPLPEAFLRANPRTAPKASPLFAPSA